MRVQLRRNRVAASVKNDVHRPIAGANRRPRHAIIDSVGDGPMHRGSQHSDQPYNCEPSHKPRQWPKATFSAYGIPCSGTVAAQLSHGFVQIVDRGTVALIETEPQEGGYAKPGRSFRQLGGSRQHQGGSPRVISIMGYPNSITQVGVNGWARQGHQHPATLCSDRHHRRHHPRHPLKRS